MIIYENCARRVQAMIKRFIISKDALERAEAIHQKCREALIKDFCIDKGTTSEKIQFGEEGFELNISGSSRTDTSWTKAWKDFDKQFYPLIEADSALSAEYLRIRRTAEINNQKSPYMRWEIRKKNTEE
jgi:hypothetical protein